MQYAMTRLNLTIEMALLEIPEPASLARGPLGPNELMNTSSLQLVLLLLIRRGHQPIYTLKPAVPLLEIEPASRQTVQQVEIKAIGIAQIPGPT